MEFRDGKGRWIWKDINKVQRQKNRNKLARAAGRAIYLLGCKCQELEGEMDRLAAENTELRKRERLRNEAKEWLRTGGGLKEKTDE